MKVFVFGAGASSGSQEGLSIPAEKRAPLVNELFNPQYRSGPAFLSDEDFEQCKQGAATCGSVEQWLSKRWADVDSLREDSSKFAVRAFFGRVTFYLWSLLQQVSYTYTDANGYSLFLKRLISKDEPSAFISFNYDTLLDQAVQSRFGASLLTLNDYLTFRLIKPHGSVNWMLPARPDDPVIIPVAQYEDVMIRTATSRLFNGASILFSRALVYPPRSSQGSSLEGLSSPGGHYSYPLLFMPLTTKLYPMVSDFDNIVIGRGKELLRQATQVYLIGYRAADDIMQEMFLEVRRGTPIHVVGRGSAGDVMTSVLRRATHLIAGETYEEGFMRFATTY